MWSEQLNMNQHYSLKVSWEDAHNGNARAFSNHAKAIQLSLGHAKLKRVIREWVERVINQLSIRNQYGQLAILPQKFFLYALNSDIHGREYFTEAPSSNIVEAFHYFAR